MSEKAMTNEADMSNDEVNRYIHEEILGLCSSCQMAMHSTHEDECVPFGFPPDYCSDSSPRSLLNEVVAKVDWLAYDRVLQRMSSDGQFFAGLVYRATAKQIARACVKAHQEQSNEQTK